MLPKNADSAYLSTVSLQVLACAILSDKLSDKLYYKFIYKQKLDSAILLPSLDLLKRYIDRISL